MPVFKSNRQVQVLMINLATRDGKDNFSKSYWCRFMFSKIWLRSCQVENRDPGLRQSILSIFFLRLIASFGFNKVPQDIFCFTWENFSPKAFIYGSILNRLLLFAPEKIFQKFPWEVLCSSENIFFISWKVTEYWLRPGLSCVKETTLQFMLILCFPLHMLDFRMNNLSGFGVCLIPVETSSIHSQHDINMLSNHHPEQALCLRSPHRKAWWHKEVVLSNKCCTNRLCLHVIYCAMTTCCRPCGWHRKHPRRRSGRAYAAPCRYHCLLWVRHHYCNIIQTPNRTDRHRDVQLDWQQGNLVSVLTILISTIIMTKYEVVRP